MNSTDVASTPGNMNVCRLDAAHRGVGQRREAGAEDEQEQDRLDEEGDDADAVLAEAQQLALPDDLDPAQVLTQTGLDDAHGPEVGAGLGGGRRRSRVVDVVISVTS